MHWLQSLRARLPSSAASEPIPKAIQEAFAAECEARFDSRGRIVMGVVLACTFLWWPVDWIIWAGFPDVIETMARTRVVMAVMSTLYVLLPRARLSPRALVALFTLTSVVCAAMTGFSAGALGGPDRPYFHLLYVIMFGTVPMPLAPGLRLAVTALVGGATLGGFLLPYPEHLRSPYAPLCVSFLTFMVLLSTWFGHVQFVLTRRTFVDARKLAEHGRLLESRVAERTLELRRLVDHIETAREDERARISRELHDELGQELSALRYSLGFTRGRYRKEPGGIEANLEDLEDLLRRTAQTTRRLVTDLRPRVLDDLGLGAAMEWLVRRVEQRGDLACALLISGELDTLEGRVATAAFRVLQEALTNVARHARASRVEVSITAHGDALELRVVDDGTGIDAARAARGEAESGVGLLGMRERVHALGGEISIRDRRPERGTEIACRLPLAPESRKPSFSRGDTP